MRQPAIDFAILDNCQPSSSHADASKSVKISGLQSVPQHTPGSLPGSEKPLGSRYDIQTAKRELSYGIKSGDDPYPLLLKAIRAIAGLTDDISYYTMLMEIMQGAGLLDAVPAEWERDSVEHSRQSLEASRQRIATAIEAHQRRLDGCAEDVAHDEYTQRIRQCFGTAYKFITDHAHPRTDDDWAVIAGNLDLYTDPLAVDLIVAGLNELDRECKTGIGIGASNILG